MSAHSKPRYLVSEHIIRVYVDIIEQVDVAFRDGLVRQLGNFLRGQVLFQ